MDKYEWINPENYCIAVDDHRQPVLNENGDLIILDNKTGKCIAVPNTEEILDVFGFAYSTNYGSPSGSSKDSSERYFKAVVQVQTESDQLLWSMRTPCQKDIEATKEMLALVASKKYQDMFNDQCTVKIRVWKRICEELMDKGYRIADSVNEGGIKCHQKWRNLEKSYRNFIINSTYPSSSTPKKPPPYFELLHEILKKKKKYENVTSYTQTVVSNDDMIDPETPNSDGNGLQNYLNASGSLEVDLDYIDGQNGDHCYVVNSSGHLSKQLKTEPLTVCSTTSGDIVSNSGTVGQSLSLPSSRRQIQQPDVLEQILEQMVRVHRDTLTLHEQYSNKMEKLMKENIMQTKRLIDVMDQLLQNSRDCGNNKKKSMDMLSSGYE